MSKEKFFTSKKALVTLIAASLTVIFAMGIRQTFGLFFFDFNTDLNISISHFGCNRFATFNVGNLQSSFWFHN